MPGGCQYSLKLDGFRAAAFALPDGPALQARSGSDLTERFPELRGPLAALPIGTVADGVIVAWTDGRFAFEELLRTPGGRSRAHVAVSYVAFDLLAMPDGHGGSHDVRTLTLKARWSHLTDLMAGLEPPLELVMATTDRSLAMAWVDALAPTGVEGLVIKPLGGTYSGARWVKARVSDTVDADAVALIGLATRPYALRVRLPDGTHATTTPTLDALQARQVATAAYELLADTGPQPGGQRTLTEPLRVEVRVVSGRHQVVRFVRVRGE